MHKLWSIISVLALACFMTGCMSRGCEYPTECWKGYFVNSSRGVFIHSPCEKLCDQCTFNEPVCQACWTCVDRDGCGFGCSHYTICKWR